MKLYRKVDANTVILCRTDQEIKDCLTHLGEIDFETEAPDNFSAPLYVKIKKHGKLGYPKNPKHYKHFIYFSSIAFHGSDFLFYDSDIIKSEGSWELFIGRENEISHVRCANCERDSYEITKFCPHCGSNMNIQYQMSDSEIKDWLLDHDEELLDYFGYINYEDIITLYQPWEIIKIIHEYEAGYCFKE